MKQLNLAKDVKTVTAKEQRQKQLLEAHRDSDNGLRLGTRKSQRKGFLDTPLFSELGGSQTTLF